jgi:Uncharacterised protein domain (DUF2415)
MNYALISPDSKVLAAVGDENYIYFYEVTCDPDNTIFLSDNGDGTAEWNWNLICSQGLQKRSDADDGSCFTIAFSPSSQLCAVGSQSGIITILDVTAIRESKDATHEPDPTIGLFLSSRSCSEGGAVRCMTFSPEPWDLLVWIEDNGQAGIADARQGFTRRQIVTLDINDPALQIIQSETVASPGVSSPEDDGIHQPNPTARSIDDAHAVQNTALGPPDASPLDVQDSRLSEPQSLRDSLVEELTERERRIIDILTAQWSSGSEELDDGSTLTIHLQSGPSPRAAGPDGPNRSSRATSPFHNDTLREVFRESYLGRTGSTDRTPNPRRQGSVILSQVNPDTHNSPPEGDSSFTELQPTITLRLTASPSDMQVAESPSRATNLDIPPMGSSDNNGESTSRQLRETTDRGDIALDTSSSPADPVPSGIRQRTQPASSIPRRSERSASTVESRYDVPRATTSELRSNVAERHRRPRTMASEVSTGPNDH